MPIRKKADLINLQDFNYIKIDDSLLSDDLFDIIDFPDKLTSGKNLIKIRMQNGRFVDGSEVYIEILDFNGNPIYYEPLKYIEKDGTRVIAIYVYPDTPPGTARVYIASRLLIDDDGNEIEFSNDSNLPNFKNVPNVIWSRAIPVAPSAFNTTEIIYTKQPSLTITEIVQPFRQPVTVDAIFTNQTRPNSSITVQAATSTPASSKVSSAATTANGNSQIPTTVTKGSLNGNSPAKSQGTAIVNTSATNESVTATGGKTTVSSAVQVISGHSILQTTNFPLSASMQGGELTITNPIISVPKNTALNSLGQVIPNSQATALSNLPAGSSFTPSAGDHPLSGSYVFHVDQVVNKTTARITQISGFKNNSDNTFGGFSAKVSKKEDKGVFLLQETVTNIKATTNVTASFIKPSETVLTENSASFADIIIADTEPETGDVYRIKTLFKPSGQFGDFLDLGDTILEQQNILIDETSLETNVIVGSFYENFGQFESLQEIQKYWSSSVAGGLPINALVPEYNVDDLIGGVSLTTNWNNNTDQFTAAEGDAVIFQIKDQYKPKIYNNTTYIVRFKTTVPPSISSYKSNDKNIPDPRLDIYINNTITSDNPITEILIGNTKVPANFTETLSNQPFNNDGKLGTRIGSVFAARSAVGNIATVQLQFKSNDEENLDIKFVVRNGLFIVSDIEVLADKETGYTPNFIRISKRVPMEHMHTPLSFKFQYFDIRGNKADLETVAFGAVFDGDNNYIEGTSNLLTGSMFIGNKVASGIEMGGLKSGFIRSVGYEGLNRAIAGTGPGGFLLYSGSGQMQIGDNIEEGVGLQLVGDNDSSHLIFTTQNGGSVDVKAEKFFIGSNNTQFISGSEGNIEISSSLFHLDPQENLLVIGADAVINADLTVNSLRTPATIGGSPSTTLNASSSIDSDGFAKFASASIAGFEVVTDEIRSANEALRLKATGDITASKVLLEGGTITAGVTILGSLSANSILTPATINGAPATVNNASASISDQGLAIFRSASIAGFVVNTEEIKSSNESLRLKANGQITGSNVLFSGGTIGGFNLLSNELKSSNNNLRLKDSGQITGSNVLFNGGRIANFDIIGNTLLGKNAGVERIRLDALSGDVQIDGEDAFGITIGGDESEVENSTKPFIVAVQDDGSRTIFRVGTSGQFIKFDSGASQKLFISSSTFRLGDQSQFIEGGSGNIEISSSNFHLTPQGNVTMSGTITAEAGNIGGFTIDSDHIFDTAGNLQLTGSSGTIKASRGVIGGFDLTSDKITGNNIVIDSAGSIQTADYASDLKGWKISSDFNGFAEFENAKIRGTLATAVFEKETVNAVGGQLYVANSTNLTASADNPSGNYLPTDATMSVVNVSGFSPNEILSLKKVSATGFSTEYVKVVSASRLDPSSDTNLSGQLFLTRGYGATFPAGPSASLGDTPGGAQSYSGSQVIVSTGKIGTGFIRLNANPNNLATPYIDIVERTGSGVYDVQLKARLGDLSGLANSNLVFNKSNPGFGLATDNVFLQGGITATFGTIGGFGITSDAISSSNDNLILRDSGQITGSTVLFTGGDIGGFVLSANEIRSSNNNLRLKANGQITASEAQITGKITATEGTIGGFNIGTNLESSGGTLNLKGSSGQITGSNVLFSGGEIGGFNLTSTEISSSGLLLKSSGQITGSNVLLEGGRITSNVTIEGSVTANAIRTPATIAGSPSTAANASSSIDSNGFAKFVSASIAGFDITTNEILGNRSVAYSANVVANGAQGETDVSFVVASSNISPSYPGGLNALLNKGGLWLSASVGGNGYFFDPDENPSVYANIRDFSSGLNTIRLNNSFTIGAGDGDDITEIAIVDTTSSNYPFVTDLVTSSISIDASDSSIELPKSSNFGDTGIQLQFNSGTPRFFAGAQNGGFLKFDGTSTQLSSSNFNIASNGDVSMTGTVTATAGQIGGFAITPTAISSSNNNLVLKSSGQITASNADLSGKITATSGEIGGTNIAASSLSSTGNLSAPDSNPKFKLDSSGAISGSNFFARQVTNFGSGAEVVPLLDTRIGLLDGRNLGRQLVSNYDEFVRGNVDDGSTFVTVNEHFVQLLPYENTLLISYQLRVDANANGVQGGLQFQLQSMTHSGSFTAATNFDNFTDAASTSTAITRTSSGTSLAIGAGAQAFKLTIPESAQAQTCRIQVEMRTNVFSTATTSTANKTTLKGYSIIATRQLSANTAGAAREEFNPDDESG